MKSFVKGFIKQGVAKGFSIKEMEKKALHAHERIEERLNLPAESVDQIQKAVDSMWYKYGRGKLNEARYYTPIRDPNAVIQGYAALQRVGKHPYSSRLIVTTILSKDMKPRGSNIGHFFNAAVPGFYVDKTPKLEKYDGMDPVPNNKGK